MIGKDLVLSFPVLRLLSDLTWAVAQIAPLILSAPLVFSFCLSGCLSVVSLTFPYVDYIRDHNEETTHAHQMTFRCLLSSMLGFSLV